MSGLGETTVVEASVPEDRLAVQPQPEPENSLRLDDLLRDITDENLHGEWQTGPAVGKEVW
jgi:antitoxin component of MazEF toxin-antitoxin module